MQVDFFRSNLEKTGKNSPKDNEAKSSRIISVGSSQTPEVKYYF